MRKTRTVNISNTFRSLNLATRLPYGYYYPVTDVLEPNFLKIRNQIETDNLLGHYVLKHRDKSAGYDDSLNRDLILSNARFTYLTDSTVPFHIISLLNGQKFGEAMYLYHQHFSDKELRNMYDSSLACNNAILCTVVHGKLSPRDILFSLNDIRYHMARVDLYFKPLNKKEVKGLEGSYNYSAKDNKYHLQSILKLQYFLSLHEWLARWGIRLTIVCDSPAEIKYIEEQGKLKGGQLA